MNDDRSLWEVVVSAISRAEECRRQCQEFVAELDVEPDRSLLLPLPEVGLLMDRRPRRDYTLYLASDHWQEVRARTIERDGGHCMLCRSRRALQVHHNSYRNLGAEQDDDLVCLCRRCHRKFHGITPLNLTQPERNIASDADENGMKGQDMDYHIYHDGAGNLQIRAGRASVGPTEGGGSVIGRYCALATARRHVAKLGGVPVPTEEWVDMLDVDVLEVYRVVQSGWMAASSPSATPKLFDVDPKEVRRLVAEGLTQSEVAARLGISDTTVSRIVRREGAWAD